MPTPWNGERISTNDLHTAKHDKSDIKAITGLGDLG